MSDNKTDGRNASDRLALVVLVSLILWFCRNIIFSPQVPFFRDLSTYFYPMRYSLFESYRSGNLPLWDRHMAMGFPLLADFQSGAFYPPHLLFLVLPFFPAIRALFIFHFLVAGVGSYCLCRSWNHPPWLSIVGALLFTLGGTIVSLSNLLNHFQTAVWLPWVILSWETILRSISWKNFLAFTLILAIQLLAGSPELFATSMALVIIDGLRVKVSDSEISFGRVISIFVSANLVVLMLVMIQLLPTVELFLESRRQQVIPYQEAVQWSLNPMSLMNLFFLDKELDPSVPNGIRLFFGRQVPFLVSYYLGGVFLFGVGLWFCWSSRREKIFSLILVVVSLVMAFGGYTSVYPFLYLYVPILAAIRFPEKFFFLTYSLLLFMTMRGLGGLHRPSGRSPRITLIVLFSICLIWVGLYVFLRSRSDILSQFIVAQSGIPPFSDVQAKATASVLASLERQVILSLGVFLLIYLARRNLIRASLLGYLLVSAVFVDLAWAHHGLLFPLNPVFVNKGPRIMQQPDSVLSRIFFYPSAQNLHPSSFMAQGQPSFKQATAITFQDLLPNSGILYGFDYMQEIDALARRPYTDFIAFANQLDPAQQIKLLRTFNVGYLVSLQPMSVDGIIFVKRFPQYFSWLYRIDKPLPRTYIVNRISVEQNSDQIFRRLLEAEFNPAEEVVLDQSLPIEAKGSLKAIAKIVDYEDQRVIVEASLNDAGILVLADSFYPGWKAYVDGKEEKIRRANFFFRAVPLTSGEHRVEFRYEPVSVKIGLAISVITLAACLITSLGIYARKRKPRTLRY